MFFKKKKKFWIICKPVAAYVANIEFLYQNLYL